MKSDAISLIVKSPFLIPHSSPAAAMYLCSTQTKVIEKFAYGHQLTSFPFILSWIDLDTLMFEGVYGGDEVERVSQELDRQKGTEEHTNVEGQWTETRWT